MNCNKQSSDWECGYYVMNWMHEFLLFRQHNFQNNIWKDTRPFSDVQLDERVNTWMKTFGEKHLKSEVYVMDQLGNAHKV
ncbi:hypothetical protein LXL04_012417 [Taraxacum kok-saghyz]